MSAKKEFRPKRTVESKPGPPCECGKAAFRSVSHARAHARNAHSERMRIYTCRHGSIHLTNHEKSRKMLPMTRKGRVQRRATTRRERYKSKRALQEYNPEDPVAERGRSA